MQKRLKYSKQVERLLENVVKIAIQIKTKETPLKTLPTPRDMGMIGISASRNSLEVFMARKKSKITAVIRHEENSAEKIISRFFRPLPEASKITAESKRFMLEYETPSKTLVI